MTYVITSRCAGVKDGACREVCPCDCIYDAGEQFVINPDDCIDCGACVAVCPVGAVFADLDLPAADSAALHFNRAFFER
ncbi:ferredoxin family protein [Deinococcus sp. KNUC1210]|uniref:indolepyruvate ferredoxin oxidoreductase subunit alpha n=1 Tax=Deinococcus sp. KNUC1210 TaxID=2917691 RepID=UPI001EF02721|nr:ferredoxin family protein [Deinococcus sp. KNUC1210]ULH16373.1 ferredoxin family protein [Deinococcus sp. KNUC1210]